MIRHTWDAGGTCNVCGISRVIYRVSDTPSFTWSPGGSPRYTYITWGPDGSGGTCAVNVTRERPDCKEVLP